MKKTIDIEQGDKEQQTPAKREWDEVVAGQGLYLFLAVFHISLVISFPFFVLIW